MDAKLNHGKEIIRRLREAGHQAVFAGGCVRDRLLGTTPKDYDIATSATPDQIQAQFEKTVAVGAKFGVILVVTDVDTFEVATFRKDGVYEDGRRPAQVEFTNLKEDSARRDFTVNGLYWDPEKDEVIDFVGGREDLERGVIRSIGDPACRFEEDHLRMLRAVRFSVQLGFALDAGTEAAIKGRAERVSRVSSERIRDEWNKTLTSPNPARGIRMMDACGLLQVVMPEMEIMKGVEQPSEYHPEGDVYVHTMLLMEGLKSPELELAMGCLLHDVAKPATFERAPDRIRFHGHDKLGAEMAGDICRRLSYPTASTRLIQELVLHHLRFKDAFQMRSSTLKRFFRLPRFDLHLELHRLDCLASHGNLEAYEFCKEKYAEFLKEPPPPAKLISGEDLKSLGLSTGPLFKEILNEVENQILEGKIVDREQALDFVRREYGDKTGWE